MSHSTDRRPVAIETIEAYLYAFHQARIFWQRYPGAARCLGIFKFNTEYFNKDFYNANPSVHRNFISTEYETNIEYNDSILEDILRFFMSTDIHTLTGLSIEDVLSMDYVTYGILKKIYDEIDAPRKKALLNMQRQMHSPSQDKQVSAEDIKEQLRHEQRTGHRANW